MEDYYRTLSCVLLLLAFSFFFDHKVYQSSTKTHHISLYTDDILLEVDSEKSLALPLGMSRGMCLFDHLKIGHRHICLTVFDKDSRVVIPESTINPEVENMGGFIKSLLISHLTSDTEHSLPQ